MDLLTSQQVWWLVGSVITGIILLIVIPLVSVANEVAYLNSSEAEEGKAMPMKSRFDVVYWPVTVSLALCWIAVIAIMVKEEPDFNNTMWKMLGIYSILVFFSYFMHVAGKNYVIQREIETDKNIQMAAILATFTIVIYIAGCVAAIMTLITGRRPEGDQAMTEKVMSMLRQNKEIERWPSKIDKITGMYEKIIENIGTYTAAERTQLRKAFSAALKKAYTFEEAYKALQKLVNDIDIDDTLRQAFLVQSADIIMESDNKSDTSFFKKLMNVIKPALVHIAGSEVSTGPARKGDPAKANDAVPNKIEVLLYEGSYIDIFVEDSSRNGEIYNYILPKNTLKPIEYNITTNKTIEESEVNIDIIKN